MFEMVKDVDLVLRINISSNDRFGEPRPLTVRVAQKVIALVYCEWRGYPVDVVEQRHVEDKGQPITIARPGQKKLQLNISNSVEDAQ